MKKPATLSTFSLVLLLGALTAFDPLSIDMYLPAFPEIQKDFGVSFSLVELSLSFFFIGMTVGQLIYGPLSDRFGRRVPLLIGTFIYMVSSLLCGLSPTIESFIALRFFQALGGSAGMVVSRAVVRDSFDKRRSAQIYSALMLVMGVAPILAPLIGGQVVTHMNWHAIFFILAGLSALSLLSIYFFLPETQPQSSRQQLSWKNSFADYKTISKDLGFIGFCFSSGAIRAGMFAYIASSPFVFIELFKVPPDQYGWIFGSNALGLIGASQLNGFLLKKFSPEKILQYAISGAVLFATLLFVLPFFSASFWALSVPLFFFLMMMGFVGPNSAAGALAGYAEKAGTASALFGTYQWTVAFGSSFIVSQFHNGTSVPMRSLIFISALLAFVLYYFLVSRQFKNSPSTLEHQEAELLDVTTNPAG